MTSIENIITEKFDNYGIELIFLSSKIIHFNTRGNEKEEIEAMRKIFLLLFVSVLTISGCGAPQIKFFTDSTDPLNEFCLEGKAKEKILIIPIRGIISTAPDEGMLSTKPSLVQEVVAQLKRAEEDKYVKAVILQIDSLGGMVTASDILYHEIKRFKEKKRG